MRLDEDTRKQIQIAVAVGLVLLVFVEPVLRFVWLGLVWTGCATWSGVVDAIHRSAVRGYPDMSSAIVLWAVMALFCVTMSGIDFLLLLLFAEKPTKVQRLRKHIRLAGAVITAITALFLAQMVARCHISSRFHRRIAVLAPAISERDEEQMLAEWAEIRTREDYLALNERIDGLAREHGVELPDRGW